MLQTEAANSSYFTGKKAFVLIVCLGFINALTPFTIDLYLPAFADIAEDLNTIVPRVSLSVATYFVGFALGQILYGPLLDRFGRKPPMFFGLTLYLISTLGCMTAQTVEELLIFRFLSALGGSAGSVGAVTMVRDYFPPKDSVKVFSMLMLVLSVSPLFAPTIGGWIAAEFGWRTIFGTLFVMALANVFIIAFLLPKAYTPHASASLRLSALRHNFTEVLKTKQFRTYTFAGAFSFSGLFVYLAGSPSIFIEGFGLTKQQYGYVFAFLAVGMIGGGQVNNLLIKKFESRKIYSMSVIAQAMIALVFAVLSLTTSLNFVATTSFFFLLMSSVGIAYPNAASLALEPFSKNVGTASSLLGFFQMGLGAALASLVGLLDMSGTLPTALVISLSSALALLVLFGRK